MAEVQSEDEVSELISRTTKIDLSDLLCPICADVFVFPRTYSCGHTVCETCMYEMDIRQLADDTHVAVVYKCPVCREPTLKSWNNRPMNFLLEQLSSRHPNYVKRKEEVLEMKKQRKSKLVSISDTVDLAKTCYNSRINLALDLYDILLEKLYIAAKDGKNHLIIKEKSIVSDIEKVADILSYQLFSKHNVYRMLTTRKECTIYLTRSAFTWRRNYENLQWSDPTESSPEEFSSLLQSSELPPPPPPPSVNTHSPLIHRRNFRRSPVGLSPRSFFRRN